MSHSTLTVWRQGAIFAAAMLASSAGAQNVPPAYRGVPYSDSSYKGGAQKVPGEVQPAYYDLGGEGVAYHDIDPQNHGSGELNPPNGTYLNAFRAAEGVDTSYTKFANPSVLIDDNPYNRVVPPEHKLYVGWTEPGEWFNITVDAAKDSDYAADLLYTANRDATISVDVNGKAATGPIAITPTFDPAEPVAWRQWHHWNRADGLVRLHLAAGLNVLTIHILTGGNMNLAALTFHETGAPSAREAR